MREVLVERGVPRERILDIPNYLPDDHLLPDLAPSEELRRELGLPTDGRMFMFAGNMGSVQCLEPLVEAFARVPEVNLVMIGDGIVRADLERYVAQRAIGNVHFVGMQPPDRIGAFIAASDVQIVSLNDTPLLRITTPSKVQAAIAAGRPVFVHAAGDVADLITRNGAGLAVTPGDPDRVAARIREFAGMPEEAVREMGRRSRVLYEAEFTAEVLLDRLEQMMNPAAPPRSRRLIRQRSGAEQRTDLEVAGGRR
jgi:glycosyltransferase involved in cell wall biosynthesis